MQHTIHHPERLLILLDFVGTLAAAGLVLFAGYALQRRVRPLARYNIPAPVIGGLLVALASPGARGGRAIASTRRCGTR
jgi:Na+/glutamate symporter